MSISHSPKSDFSLLPHPYRFSYMERRSVFPRLTVPFIPPLPTLPQPISSIYVAKNLLFLQADVYRRWKINSSLDHQAVRLAFSPC